MTKKSKLTIKATIVAPEMVWLVYFDEFRNKHFKELTGQAAIDYIEKLKNDEP